MKRTISLLLMGFVGLVGTYAWAGTAREDSVERLQKKWAALLPGAPFEYRFMDETLKD